MYLNQQLVTMAAICAIDIGGEISKKTALWLSRDHIMERMTATTKARILKRTREVADGRLFEEAQEWLMFAKKGNAITSSIEEVDIDVSDQIVALAIFYVSIVKSKAEEIFNQYGFDKKIDPVFFDNLIASNFEYDPVFLAKYMVEKQKVDVEYDLQRSISDNDVARVETIILEDESPLFALLETAAKGSTKQVLKIDFEDKNLKGFSEKLQKASIIAIRSA